MASTLKVVVFFMDHSVLRYTYYNMAVYAGIYLSLNMVGDIKFKDNVGFLKKRM